MLHLINAKAFLENRKTLGSGNVTKTQDCFINILKAYINGENVALDADVDLNELYKYASIHNVLGIFAVMNKKYGFNLSKEMEQNLNKYMMSSVALSVNWDTIYNNIAFALSEAKIKNIIVKGPIIKKYYPDPDLRTMGDIDIIIKADEMKKAFLVMEKMGFELCESNVDEYKFKKGRYFVELHEDLTSDDFGNGIDYKKEMQVIFDNTKNFDGYNQELKDEYHLIYLILHIAHHLVSTGCGVRQIMDIALLIKNVEIDKKAFWDIADKLKLKDLSHNVFCLCKRWFGVEFEDWKADEKLYDIFSKYILEGGVFGFEGGREDNSKIRKSLNKNKFVFIIENAFPNEKYMRSHLSWFRNKSVIFLPVAWVIRWIKSYSDHSEKIKAYLLRGLKGKDQKATDELNMLKKLGFYKQ